MIIISCINAKQQQNLLTTVAKNAKRNVVLLFICHVPMIFDSKAPDRGTGKIISEFQDYLFIPGLWSHHLKAWSYFGSGSPFLEAEISRICNKRIIIFYEREFLEGEEWSYVDMWLSKLWKMSEKYPLFH